MRGVNHSKKSHTPFLKNQKKNQGKNHEKNHEKIKKKRKKYKIDKKSTTTFLAKPGFSERTVG